MLEKIRRPGRVRPPPGRRRGSFASLREADGRFSRRAQEIHITAAGGRCSHILRHPALKATVMPLVSRGAGLHAGRIHGERPAKIAPTGKTFYNTGNMTGGD